MSPEILSIVADYARGKQTMVSLDSDHRYEHLKKEVEAYGSFVTPGQYMVVEDIGIYDQVSAERPPDFEPAVLADLEIGDAYWGTAAVAEFCRAHREFVQDRTREKHLVTGYAWLKRLTA